jgi:aryl-alcohol dehydrogenase-like predicted oxidoreductase
MLYRQLGKSELEVSRIGFGCMSLKDEKTAATILHRALDLGINYFDTADLYDKGANETLVGRALKEKRKLVVLATKAGNQWRMDGSGWDWNPRKEYILQAAEASLKRLDTDYIDLYQLHGGTMDDPVDETIEAFEQLVQEGKIRYYGISSIRPNVIREWAGRSSIVSVMMQYSLLDRRPEEASLSLLQQKKIGVVIRGSVAQGLLVDKPAKPYLNYSATEVALAAKTIHTVSGGQVNAGQTAIRFVLHHPAVTAAVVGMRTMEQMEEAVRSIDLPSLSQEEYRLLQDALPANLYQEHR